MKTPAILILPAALLLCAAPSFAASDPVVLAGVDLDSDLVTLHLTGAAESKVNAAANPPRLLVDLQNATDMTPVKTIFGQGKFVRGVRIGQLDGEAAPTVRVIIELQGKAEYQTAWEGGNMALRVGPGTIMPPVPRQAIVSARPTAEPAPAQPEPAKPAPAAPKPQPKAPHKTVAAAGAYLVQVGSFSDEKRAQGLKASLPAAVSPVTVSRSDAGGKSSFKVRVGPFASRSEADAMLEKLSGLGHKAFVVKNK